MDGSWMRGDGNRRESTVDSPQSKAEEPELKRRLAMELEE
jgi:hypothetical protein